MVMLFLVFTAHWEGLLYIYILFWEYHRFRDQPYL